MSAASDKYEHDVANYINKISGVKAVRPTVSVKYPDVKITYKGETHWMEVKMNHTDNLGNPRVSYTSGKWDAARPLDPVKEFAIDYLTKSNETKTFLKDIAKFAGLNWQKMILPSTKGPLTLANAVPYNVVVQYFKTRQQYILDVPNVDLGKLVAGHYLKAKEEPAYYLQAGDDFYMIGTQNPFGLPKDIPNIGQPRKSIGNFKMRIGVRSSASGFYEIQPEIKITNMPISPYSVMPGTKKKNPFK